MNQLSHIYKYLLKKNNNNKKTLFDQLKTLLWEIKTQERQKVSLEVKIFLCPYY